MLATAARRALLAPGKWVSNNLWRRARAVPSLDLRFAENKSLVDATTGANLVTFTRASSGTYVDSTGVIRTATTNEPRFDHNPTTGESLGLLVEEQRTNLLLYSEDTSQWLTPTNITLSQNQTTAPDGASTADCYLETSATGLHAQDSPPFLFVTGITYTYSVFVKSIEGRNFEIGYPPTTFTARFARFNLSGAGSVQGVDAGITAGIQAYPGSWFRCWATNTCASGTSTRISNFINNASFSRNYAGNTSSGVFIWGSQLEAGFPTSYIPTTTSAVTRSADVASISGSNFSGWYRQDEGTVFTEITPQTTTAHSHIGFDDGGSERWRIGWLSANASNLVMVDGGVVQMNTQTSANDSWPVNARRRAAAAYKVDDIAVSLQGANPVSDTSATLPTPVKLTIGIADSAAQMTGTIRRLTYFPQRLPNNVLQALTL